MTEQQYKQNERNAAIFAQAIVALAKDADALENLKSYLCYHFPVWLEKYANTPENLAGELKNFAEIYSADVETA